MSDFCPAGSRSSHTLENTQTIFSDPESRQFPDDIDFPLLIDYSINCRISRFYLVRTIADTTTATNTPMDG